GMDGLGGGPKCGASWKRMSKEELENQYSPSRWVVRLGAEEALRTYSQIGNEALPFLVFFHGGYWQSGRLCAEEGGKPPLKSSTTWITLKSFGT
uniref:Arylformamidase n=1 Tax=Balaenoptera musculus TaxID=9771 RepID=A0A8C0E1U5_BALMU